MSLSIAYRHEGFEPQEKAEQVKKPGKREMRVALWMARQYEKDYQDAIKQHMADIRMIQQHIPGWMPAKR